MKYGAKRIEKVHVFKDNWIFFLGEYNHGNQAVQAPAKEKQKSNQLQGENNKLKVQMEDLERKVQTLQEADQGDLNSGAQLGELQLEILDECRKVAKNEVSSCYELVEKTRELMKIESVTA